MPRRDADRVLAQGVSQFPGEPRTKGAVEFAVQVGRHERSFYQCRPAWDPHGPRSPCQSAHYNVSYRYTSADRHVPSPQLVRSVGGARSAVPGAVLDMESQQQTLIDVAEAFRKYKAHGRLALPAPVGHAFGGHCFGRARRSEPLPTQEQKEERLRLYEQECRRLRHAARRRPASAGADRGLYFGRRVGRETDAVGTPRPPSLPESLQGSDAEEISRGPHSVRSRPPSSAPGGRGAPSAGSPRSGDAASVAGSTAGRTNATAAEGAPRRRQRQRHAELPAHLISIDRQQRRTLAHYEWIPDSYPTATALADASAAAPECRRYAQHGAASPAARRRVPTPRERHVPGFAIAATSGRECRAPWKTNAMWLESLLKRKVRRQAEQEAHLQDHAVTCSTFAPPRANAQGRAYGAASIFLRGGRDLPVRGRLWSDAGQSARWARREAAAVVARVTQARRLDMVRAARARRQRAQQQKQRSGRGSGAQRTAAALDEAGTGRSYAIFSPSQLSKVAAESARHTEAAMGSASYGILIRQARAADDREAASTEGVRAALAAAGAETTPTHAAQPRPRLFGREDD